MNRTEDTSAPFSLRGRTILVVEDEYFLATGVSRALAAAGAQVVGPFPALDEAFAALDAGRPLDAALLDVNLRGEMVYPLADALRRRGVALVFMTGYDRAALPPAYRDCPVCEKPVDVRDFVDRLAAAKAQP